MSGILRTLSKFWTKNATKILTITASGGVIVTGVTGYFAGTKVPLIVDRLKETYGDDIPKKELVKAVALPLLPPVVSGGLTIASIVANEAINTKQKAILTGIASASEIALQKYQEKAKQLLGEDKERTITDEIAKEEIHKNPITDNYVFATGRGDSLCYDAWTGRYFTSDYAKIEQAVNEFNKLVIGEMWARLNDWYDMLGLPEVESGDAVGWNVDHLLECTYTSEFADDGRPCRVITFRHKPVPYNYRTY